MVSKPKAKKKDIIMNKNCNKPTWSQLFIKQLLAFRSKIIGVYYEDSFK